MVTWPSCDKTTYIDLQTGAYISINVEREKGVRWYIGRARVHGIDEREKNNV